MVPTSDPPPRGFRLEPSDDDHFVIEYRTTGMGCAGVFFAVWLTVWTVGCVTFTGAALFAPDGIKWSTLLLMLPFWGAEFLVLGYVVWFFWSVTRFTFALDQLEAERSIPGYRRYRVFSRSQITSVRQIKDGGEGEDSFPSWGLVVIGSVGVIVLSRQPKTSSDWLGPIIATWAGAPYIPYEPPEKESFQRL